MIVDINRLGINGEGIAINNIDEQANKVCFISGALPNEKVDVSIVEDKKNFTICRLEKIVSKSENRIIPKCPYFHKCGGCDLQHMNNELQIKFKKNKVQDTLRKIAKIDVDIDDTIRVNDYGYRNKMVYPVVTCDNKPKVGMFEGSSHRIVDIDKCLIASDVINNLFRDIKVFIENSKFVGYDFDRKKGDIKYIVIREHSGQVLVTVVSVKNILLKPLYEYLHSKYNSIGLSLIISDSDTEIMSGRYIHIDGIKTLTIEEFGIKYKVDNRGFLQVNNQIKARLYQSVLDNIAEDDIVIDGYSGAGLMSAIIAKKCKQVIGIEINQSASNSAKQLTKDNNLDNMQCITSDIKYSIDDIIENIDNCVVVLDPARSGCSNEVISCLINDNHIKKIKKIIYVSCNPATLARDLAGLKDYYDIESVIPWDMFPQTKHVETLVVLERKL